MYFARCNLLWICWCQLSCQRFKIYFIIKGLKSVKGIEQLTGEGSGGRCRPSAGTRQSPGRVPGGSEVLAFYKQYNQRKKLIKMQENLYILFDAVLRFTNFKMCYLLNVTFWWEYNALQFHSSRLYWRLNQVYARGFFLGGGVERGLHEHPKHPLATALYKIIQCVAIFDSYMNNIIFRYPLLQVDWYNYVLMII